MRNGQHCDTFSTVSYLLLAVVVEVVAVVMCSVVLPELDVHLLYGRMWPHGATIFKGLHGAGTTHRNALITGIANNPKPSWIANNPKFLYCLPGAENNSQSIYLYYSYYSQPVAFPFLYLLRLYRAKV